MAEFPAERAVRLNKNGNISERIKEVFIAHGVKGFVHVTHEIVAMLQLAKHF